MIVSPSLPTLTKYGLILAEWWGFIPTRPCSACRGRGDVTCLVCGGTGIEHYCAICEKHPPSGRMVVDHAHVPRWKYLPAEKRKLYVRGVICTFCNRYVLGRFGTALKHRNAARYLDRFAKGFAKAVTK